MSKQLVIAALCLLGFALGICGSYTWNAVADWNAPAKQDRKIASTIPTGKVHSPIQVTIFPPEIVPADDENEVELKAWINKKDENMGQIQYTWRLPDGVTTSDKTQDILNDLQAGVTRELTLHVKGFSKTDKRIVVLEAIGYRGEQRLGSSAAISSRPEDSMEFIAPIMADVSPESPIGKRFHK